MRHLKPYLLPAALGLCLLACGCIHTEEPATPMPETRKVTGSNIPQPVAKVGNRYEGANQNVSVFDQDDIRTQGGGDINHLVRTQPQFR